MRRMHMQKTRRIKNYDKNTIDQNFLFVKIIVIQRGLFLVNLNSGNTSKDRTPKHFSI